MSLINDALKRASESDRNRPAHAPLPRPMRPTSAPAGTGGSWVLVVSIVAALCVALAGWFLWKGWRVGNSVGTAPAAQPAQKIAAVPPPFAPKPAPVIQESPPPVAAVQPAPVPAPPAPVPEEWPIKLTVKAIFYSKTNPHALVNGKTVETGDKIGDVLITGILSDRIFVDWKGQSRIIMMGEQ